MGLALHPMGHVSTMPLSWHQKQAVSRAWRLRNLPAHILEGDAGTVTLCGRRDPKVTVDADARKTPNNRTCKACLRIADRRSLPTREVPGE